MEFFEGLGVLGLSLVFVCIALLINAVCTWRKIDVKSMAVMNIITGFVIVTANIVGLTKTDAATTIDAYMNITAGFLFGFTYIFIAANLLFNLNPEPFGWFCLFVAVFAVVNGIYMFTLGFVFFGLLWIIWALLWGEGFLQFVPKLKGMDKVYPFLALFVSIVGAGLPAMLMLFDKFPM